MTDRRRGIGATIAFAAARGTLLLSAAVCAASALPAYAGAEDRRPTVAVMDFEHHATSEDALSALQDRVLVALARQNHFRIVERAEAAAVLREFGFAKSGYTSSAQGIKAGRMLGAEFLVFGTVDRFECRSVHEPIAYTRRLGERVRAIVEGNVRVIETRTGEVIAVAPVVVHDDVSNVEDAKDTCMSVVARFAEQVAVSVLDLAEPAQIVRVAPGGKLGLDRGEDGGYHVGRALLVFAAPNAQARIGARIGYARIVSASATSSEALLLKADRPVGPGSVARLDVDGQQPAADRVVPKLNW